MEDIRERLEQILESIRLTYENGARRLAQMPDGRLYREMRNGSPYYFQATGRGAQLHRRGIMRKQQLIRQLAQKKYLEISGEKLSRNMHILKTAISQLEDCGPEAVLRELPAAYTAIPGEQFFRSAAVRTAKTEDIDIPGAMEEARNEPDPQKRIERIREIQRIWAEVPFEQSGMNPEGRTKVTSRSLKVRSKSEGWLSELYYRYDIPFRYEQVIWIGKYRFAPDFTFLDAYAREHYWEHSGVTKDPGYLNRRRWKLSLYEQAGIVPWDNFIETFDDEDGNIDLEIAGLEIKGKLMKRLYLI